MRASERTASEEKKEKAGLTRRTESEERRGGLREKRRTEREEKRREKRRETGTSGGDPDQYGREAAASRTRRRTRL